MKLKLHLLAACFVTSLLVPTLGQAQMACNTLVITGHPTYPPVSQAQGSTLVGLAPDLVSDISGNMGVEVVIKNYGSWELAQAATRSGMADIIFGIYKNNERMAWLDYIDPPFMMDPVSIVVRKGDAFSFSGWDDLKGHRGVTNEGESFGNKFDAFIADELTVSRTQSVDKAFEALVDKRADYLIIGLYPGQLEAQQLNLTKKVKFLSHEVDSFGMYVAFSKASKCNAMKAEFSKQLSALVQSGSIIPESTVPKEQ